MTVHAVLIFVDGDVACEFARVIFALSLVISQKGHLTAMLVEGVSGHVGDPLELATRVEVFAHTMDDARLELGRAAQ